MRPVSTNYSGPAILKKTLDGEVAVEMKLIEEPLPQEAPRSWQADFTTTATAPFALLHGHCTVLLPDGRQGEAIIRGWRSLPGEDVVRGLLDGVGPFPTTPA